MNNKPEIYLQYHLLMAGFPLYLELDNLGKKTCKNLKFLTKIINKPEKPVIFTI